MPCAHTAARGARERIAPATPLDKATGRAMQARQDAPNPTNGDYSYHKRRSSLHPQRAVEGPGSALCPLRA